MIMGVAKRGADSVAGFCDDGLRRLLLSVAGFCDDGLRRLLLRTVWQDSVMMGSGVTLLLREDVIVLLLINYKKLIISHRREVEIVREYNTTIDSGTCERRTYVFFRRLIWK